VGTCTGVYYPEKVQSRLLITVDCGAIGQKMRNGESNGTYSSYFCRALNPIKMKSFFALTIVFLVSTAAFAAEVEENERSDYSIFGRANLFANALCLPLFDGCNRNSATAGCFEPGDVCDGYGSTCVKTTEGGVACGVKTESEVPCTKSTDCKRG
jgi:hypothetical protein